MIDYIVLGGIILILVLLVLLLVKSKDNSTDSLYRQSNSLEHNMIKEIARLEASLNVMALKIQNQINQNNLESINSQAKELHRNFKEISNTLVLFQEKISRGIEIKMNELNDKVSLRLDENFKKTNETFTHIVERISKIDEAQRKIEELSMNIVSLEDVLTDKKSRGCFGEVGLKQILSAVFGDRNERIYQMQYTLSNGCIADSVLFAPMPMGMLCIDSKFPLENYRRMLQENKEEAKKYEKAFQADVRKHIDDIASKYIIPNETSDQAVLFLPSEAIFATINAYHTNLVDYAYKKRVWITSPTTIMAFLTTLQVMLRNIERNKYSRVIQEELEKLSVEFGRYKIRFDKLKKDISAISNDVNEITTTTEKITNKFEKISKVNLEPNKIEANENDF